MEKLEKIIGYEFKDKELLFRALSHTSYANETKSARGSYERLEFLGDSVLSLVVAEYIFKNYRKYPEGELTKLRASLVCEKALAAFAREMGLGEFIMLGKGEQQKHAQRHKRSGAVKEIACVVNRVFNADAALGKALKDAVAHHKLLVLGEEKRIKCLLPIRNAGCGGQGRNGLRPDMQDFADFGFAEAEAGERQRRALFKRQAQKRIQAVCHLKGQILRGDLLF